MSKKASKDKIINKSRSTIHQIPCKDCITKAICRNELYQELINRTYKCINGSFYTITGISIYNSLLVGKKCSILDKYVSNIFSEKVIKSLLKEFKIDIGEVQEQKFSKNKENKL